MSFEKSALSKLKDQGRGRQGRQYGAGWHLDCPRGSKADTREQGSPSET